ncbi:MAG: molybdopterin-dependent oxidoreductase [Deltaproteobacteria bacterium]|nr:molybdopterin-dependent oxidoreductase [Deltaproteobacteria bacterium]
MAERRTIPKEEQDLFEQATGKKFSRRDFLKWTSGLAGAAIASGLIWDGKLGLFREARAQEKMAGKGRWIYTTCQMCGGTSGIKVHVVDGKVVKIEPNEYNPIGVANISTDYAAQKALGGRMCAKGNSGVRALYDPDRLKTPMKRIGPRDSDRWKAISWKEALDEVSGKLLEIREKHGPESLFWCTEDSSFTDMQSDFNLLYGSPNFSMHSNTCDVARKASFKLVMGDDRPLADFANTKYALVFGWNLLAATKWALLPGVWNLGRARGAKMVYVDPFYNQTAAKADEWIPIRPGTDGAFALALGHEIVKNRWQDEEFIRDYTVGFDKYVDFVKDKTPEWAEKITSVPAETIRRVAKELATTKPAVVDVWSGPGHHTNATDGGRAIAMLPALLGQYDKPGTMISRQAMGGKRRAFNVDKPKAPRIDGLGTKYPFAHVSGIYTETRDSMLSGQPYRLRAGVFMFQNFVMSVPNTQKNIEALKKLDYIVVLDTMMSETARLADIVIPGSHYLERWEVNVNWVTFPATAIRQPAVKSVINGMTEQEFILALARKMGLKDKDGKSLPDTYPEYISDQLKNGPIGKTLDEMLALPGGVFIGGGTQYEKYRKNGFGTPSKKIEFFSEQMEKKGLNPLPDYVEPVYKPTSGFPLYLVNYKQAEHTHSRTFNNDWLMEMKPDNPLLINAATAARLGVKDGDPVWLESPYAKAKATVRVTERIHPEVVALQHGYGHWGFGKVARGALNKINTWCPAGTADGMFLAGVSEKASGMAVHKEIGVRVTKA